MFYEKYVVTVGGVSWISKFLLVLLYCFLFLLLTPDNLNRFIFKFVDIFPAYLNLLLGPLSEYFTLSEKYFGSTFQLQNFYFIIFKIISISLFITSVG